ncbi:MAG: hypothetical protein WAL38_10175 [Solirubrobacteraceae bacterium]
MEDDEAGFGPIDVVVIGYPPGAPMTGEVVPLLLDLVDRGIICVLDALFVQSWVSASLPLRGCLGQGTATASASAVTPSRSVVHNVPFGVDHGGRGMNCRWGVHRLPRFPDSCSIGSFCMTAGVRAVAGGTNAGSPCTPTRSGDRRG